MARRLLAFFVALWCWALVAHAQPVQPIPPLSGRVVDQTGTLKLYYGITLAATLSLFVASVLFRRAAFAYDFNGTALERRILAGLGFDDPYAAEH